MDGSLNTSSLMQFILNPREGEGGEGGEGERERERGEGRGGLFFLTRLAIKINGTSQNKHTNFARLSFHRIAFSIPVVQRLSDNYGKHRPEKPQTSG